MSTPRPGVEWAREVVMAEMTPQVSELLEKALALSTQERGLLIDHLIDSLDEGPAEEGVEQAWGEEIKCRVFGAQFAVRLSCARRCSLSWSSAWWELF